MVFWGSVKSSPAKYRLARVLTNYFHKTGLTLPFAFVIIVGFAIKGEEFCLNSPIGSIASGLQCGRRAQD